MEDFTKPSVNTLEEVKKLQDLVRKLEIQNQQLRNKQNKVSKKNSLSSPKEIPKPSPVCNVLRLSNSTNIEVDENSFVSNNKYGSENEVDQSGGTTNENSNYMDEIDIIRVSDVEMSDDDSWLYISPKGLTPEQKNESPYKWLRKDVDDPDNKELQLAKKALITKLNELEILSPTSQANPPQQQQQPMNRTINHLRKPQVPFKPPPSAQEHAQYSSIDTRTFTKSKKKQALEYLASPPIVENCKDPLKKEAELCRRGSDISLDSSTGTYTLTDASDVQEVARMQEESLRLSSPIGTPKRHSVASNQSSRRMSVSSRSSISDLESLEQPVPLNQQISEDNNQETIITPPMLISTEIVNHSDHSSPSESPYGSNVSLNNAGREKGKAYRSSLPNLNKVPGGFKSKRNVANHESQQQKSFATKTSVSGRRSDSNLLAGTKLKRGNVSPTRQKLRQPMNPVSHASSTHTTIYSQTREYSVVKTSKTVETTGRLPVKSGLPRPNRAASATRTCSGIPVPASFGKKYEDSWSDGCF